MISIKLWLLTYSGMIISISKFLLWPGAALLPTSQPEQQLYTVHIRSSESNQTHKKLITAILENWRKKKHSFKVPASVFQAHIVVVNFRSLICGESPKNTFNLQFCIYYNNMNIAKNESNGKWFLSSAQNKMLSPADSGQDHLQIIEILDCCSAHACTWFVSNLVT